MKDKLKYTWTPAIGGGAAVGYGESEWGVSPWGGDVGVAGMVESFDGGASRINNFQRILLKIEENSKVPHSITYVSLLTKEKRQIRRRTLTDST